MKKGGCTKANWPRSKICALDFLRKVRRNPVLWLIIQADRYIETSTCSTVWWGRGDLGVGVVKVDDFIFMTAAIVLELTSSCICIGGIDCAIFILYCDIKCPAHRLSKGSCVDWLYDFISLLIHQFWPIAGKWEEWPKVQAEVELYKIILALAPYGKHSVLWLLLLPSLYSAENNIFPKVGFSTQKTQCSLCTLSRSTSSQEAEITDLELSKQSVSHKDLHATFWVGVHFSKELLQSFEQLSQIPRPKMIYKRKIQLKKDVTGSAGRHSCLWTNF